MVPFSCRTETRRFTGLPSEATWTQRMCCWSLEQMCTAPTVYHQTHSFMFFTVPVSLFTCPTFSYNQQGRMTPLQGACNFGHVKVAERLLQAGADINTRDTVSCCFVHGHLCVTNPNIVLAIKFSPHYYLILRSCDPIRLTVPPP